MTTREKIIVGLMCLAILYGAWELIGNRNKPSTALSSNENPVEQARNFISDLSSKVIADRVREEYRYIIDQAVETWTKDPFLLNNESLSAQKPEGESPIPEKNEERLPTLTYSGFLQAGKAKLAIINGLEYAVGDALNFENFYVKDILPEKVVVAQTKGPAIMELFMKESSLK